MQVQIHEFKFSSYEFKFTSYEFKFASYKFKIMSSKVILSTKTQVNSLNISSFPKIVRKFVRQFVRSVSNDNLVFYFPTFSWLRFRQERKWVNINFERRDLISAQKSHPSTNDVGEIIAFNLIKQNVARLLSSF